jgi:HD-GYP domain-containing protein (c-di-GMP phosphodiesterase class II)
MLRVPIASAVPGMVLAMPVLHPRRHDTVLLAAGLTLDNHTIRRLREIRLKEFWIRYPDADFVEEYICPRIFEAQATIAQQIADAFDAALKHAQPKLEYNDYRRAMNELLDRLLARPRAAIFVEEITDPKRPALRHSASVCMLALLMGLKLDDYLIVERARLAAPNARDIAGLGVAAMLHDLGMLRLPADVVERWDTSHDENADPAWRQHVQIGFDMVKDAIGPAAAAAVLHHHQKYDGTGFPARLRLDGSEEPLAGKEIHIFARIIAAADIFDRLRYPPGTAVDARRRGTPPRPTVRVLNMMRQEPFCNWLDPMVYKALLAVAPAFAPGTLVRLSTGQRAVVGEWSSSDPCRPTVMTVAEQLRDAPGDAGAGQRIDLRQHMDITIVEAEGQDVSADNFFPARQGQFDLRLAGKSLFNKAAGAA